MVSVLFVLGLVPMASCASYHWHIGGPIQAQTGTIVGQASTAFDQVSEYLGVPYAKPPLGDLRWAAPVHLMKSNATIKATKYGASCPESASRPILKNPAAPKNIGSAENEMSEDCLTLNIWTKPQIGEEKKAVLVWIYGGGFVVGSGANAVYNGAHLADEQDVVVVTLNYRVSVFGFPGVSLPDMNLGLLDQRAAIEWLRDNIAFFGGDPGRLTLFGQSAGGVSVDMYAYAYTKDPIVHGLIPQSGTEVAIWNLSPIPTTSHWSNLSQKLGCGSWNSSKANSTLKCMRSKSTAATLDATEEPVNGTQIGIWAPKFDNRTVFPDYAERNRRGDFIKVPIFVGNNNNEAATSFQQPESFVSRNYSCASAIAAQARVSNGVTAWRYLYAGTFPNMSLGPAFRGIRGAWHGSEIALIFGWTGARSLPASREEERLSIAMRFAWSLFAKDPKNGLKKLGWPQYNSKDSPVIVIGGENSANFTAKSAASLDTTCHSG